MRGHLVPQPGFALHIYIYIYIYMNDVIYKPMLAEAQTPICY